MTLFDDSAHTQGSNGNPLQTAISDRSYWNEGLPSLHNSGAIIPSAAVAPLFGVLPTNAFELEEWEEWTSAGQDATPQTIASICAVQHTVDSEWQKLEERQADVHDAHKDLYGGQEGFVELPATTPGSAAKAWAQPWNTPIGIDSLDINRTCVPIGSRTTVPDLAVDASCGRSEYETLVPPASDVSGTVTTDFAVHSL